MTKEIKKQDLYKAVKKFYEAEAHEAEAVLKMLFLQPMAVSDHTNFLEDIKKWTSKLSEAKDALEVLETSF